MANPKLETIVDAFTGASINLALWGGTTPGAATLDTVNDEVALAIPTTSGAINSVATTNGVLYDATGSYIYAQVTPGANGAGNVRTAIRVRYDGSNAVTIRLESGAFKLTSQTGSTTTLTLPAYDPQAHRWWRLREAGGSFYAGASPDGLTWTELGSLTYGFDATNVTLRLETAANAAELGGNYAVFSHVNTRAGGQFNPNWPQIDDGWGAFWNANAGTQPLDRYVDVADRTRNTVTINRGRQYELDQVRSGDASLTLANADGQLDPTNTTGQWYGHIAPYQPYRRRAQWPPTRNLLDQAMATGGDLGGYSLGTIPQGPAGACIFSSTDSTGGSFISSATAWQGSTVMQFSVPSGTAGSTRIVYTPRWSVLPGQTYTVQLRARNVTASTTLSVRAFIGYYTTVNASTLNFGTPATLTGSATAAWTTYTYTFTVPSGAGGLNCGLALDTAAAAATCSIQVDGWQLEEGATATTWQAPGAWFPVYAGWTERWTPSWTMSGTYGMVQPTAVDTFSLLSQQTLSDPLTQELNGNSPRFVFKLDDPSGSTTVADWTGTYPAAPLAVSKYGAGSLTFGNTITATDATGVYTGSTGTVARLSNSNPGTALTTGGATFIKLTNAGIKGPADPTLWTRVIAFKYTGPLPTAAACMWSCMDTQRASGQPSGSHIYVYLGTDGKPNVWIMGPTGAGAAYTAGGATNCADGNWHLLIFGYNQALQQILVSQDGATTAYFGSIPTTYTPSGIAGDNLGGFVDITVGNGTTWNWQGDISFAAEFPTYFTTAAQITNLYAAWKSACAGESTNARYARILRYASFSGATSLQSGLTTSMGPAAFDGQDAMSALQGVVDTENGAHYVDRAGVVTFKSRSARYNALTPMYTFGENTAGGEYPYEDIGLDYDSTHLSNNVTVTQESTSQNFYANDAASRAAYFPRTMARTVNSSSADECQDAANYLLSRYKQSSMRVSSLKLHPSANPALWPVVLNLELGTRVRVMRRPPGVPATQIDCFVENIQAGFDDTGECFYTLQCSPADLTPYGIFAAWHTTLNTSIASGVTSITVNASQDNTNPLAAQLAAGQSLVLGQNTANQETVTVASVGATSSGWTTAVITLTAATTKSHTAGDWVNEPLPSGVTDPTTYDSVAKFDSAAFAY